VESNDTRKFSSGSEAGNPVRLLEPKSVYSIITRFISRQPQTTCTCHTSATDPYVCVVRPAEATGKHRSHARDHTSSTAPDRSPAAYSSYYQRKPNHLASLHVRYIDSTSIKILHNAVEHHEKTSDIAHADVNTPSINHTFHPIIILSFPSESRSILLGPYVPFFDDSIYPFFDDSIYPFFDDSIYPFFDDSIYLFFDESLYTQTRPPPPPQRRMPYLLRRRPALRMLSSRTRLVSLVLWTLRACILL
jgi:hypothetical protein